MTARTWQERLAAYAGPQCTVVVVEQSTSTQDEVRRRGGAPGLIVAARRQTGGRGRLGRRWADTGGEGLAISFALEPQPAERLAIGCAVATARALESLPGMAGAGLKWPNDIVVEDGRKLAGILIEQGLDAAIVGIGVNVAQQQFPPELAGRAVSLRQLGCPTDRLEVAAALVGEMDRWHRESDDALCEAFRARDVLCGCRATFAPAGGPVVTGTVLCIDPMQGLRVRTDRQGDWQEVWLPAATTTVERWEPRAASNKGTPSDL